MELERGDVVGVVRARKKQPKVQATTPVTSADISPKEINSAPPLKPIQHESAVMVDDEKSLAIASALLLRSTEIAVDCEGVSLGKDGKLRCVLDSYSIFRLRAIQLFLSLIC